MSRYGNDVPKGWTSVKVKDVCIFISGFAFSSESYKTSGTPLVRISNIKDGSISLDDCVFVETVSDARFVVSKGDLLIAMSGATTGKMGIYSKDYSAMLNQRVGNVKVISESVLLPRYRDLYFSSMAPQILKDAYGGAQPNISAKDICEYDLLLPPIREQNRIVHEVTRYLQLIEIVERDANDLENSISRTKSLLLQMAISGKLVPQDPTDEPAIELLKRINPAFKPCDNPHYKELATGWAIMPLGNICNTINGLWKGKRKPFVNIGVIRNANFTKDFQLNYSNIEYLDVEASAFAKRSLRNGDLIVEKSGGSDKNPVGRAILYEGESEKYAFSNFTMALRIKDCQIMNNRFLYYVIMAFYLRGDMHQMQTQTTGLHNLISEKYLSMLIPVPPLEEQIRIIECIEKLFASLNRIKAIF